MNKEELIRAIIKRDNDTQEALEVILEDMLPDLNPYKIDERRFKEIYGSIIADIGTIIKKYNSTLPEGLKPLLSVEELEKELRDVFRKYGPAFTNQAQHIHSKYSLKPREWWMDLKEGDKFMFQNKVLTFERLKHYLFTEDLSPFNFNVQDCTPYTAPTADEIIAKHNLTEEEIKIIKQS